MVSYGFDMNPKRVVYDLRDKSETPKVIKDEILKTINENSFAVFQDIRNGFSQSFADIYKEIGNHFLSQVPENDLFLP